MAICLRDNMGRKLLLVVLVHSSASLTTAALMPILVGWGPPYANILGPELAYVISPVTVPVLLTAEILRLVLSLAGIGMEWHWYEPAIPIVTYIASAILFGALAVVLSRSRIT